MTFVFTEREHWWFIMNKGVYILVHDLFVFCTYDLKQNLFLLNSAVWCFFPHLVSCAVFWRVLAHDFIVRKSRKKHAWIFCIQKTLSNSLKYISSSMFPLHYTVNSLVFPDSRMYLSGKITPDFTFKTTSGHKQIMSRLYLWENRFCTFSAVEHWRTLQEVCAVVMSIMSSWNLNEAQNKQKKKNTEILKIRFKKNYQRSTTSLIWS